MKNTAVLALISILTAGASSLLHQGASAAATISAQQKDMSADHINMEATNASCQDHIKVHSLVGGNKRAFVNEVQEYQELIEQSLVYRAESIDIAKKVKAKNENDIPLSGADLHILNEGLIAHLSLRKKLYEYVVLHECWLDLTSLEAIELKLTRADRLVGVMISLSAALVLYDNYLLAISIYEEDDKLRRFLNSKDSGYNKSYLELADVTLSYNSISNRSRVRQAIYDYEKNYKKLNHDEWPQQFAYLNLVISQSPSYNLTRQYAPFRVFKNKLKFLNAVTRDTVTTLSSEGINMFSMLFGNTVGLVESRKGKLYKNKRIIKKVRNKLRAGDILLEKTPFRLTDKFIPGHWGHAAIWIGTEKELKKLGIWNHALVQKHHEQIRNGNSVVEALRSGVEISSLNKFMNIDDLGVLRANRNSNVDKINRILLALRQVGKAYDFNFDVESTSKIVCSELIYVAFTGISWPTSNTLGRYTISPDNIAVKSLDDGPLSLIMLVHDGDTIKKRPHLFMAKLLGSEQGN